MTIIMYATVEQLLERYPERDVIAITDPDNGEAVDRVKVERALADASALIDAHLGARYPVPALPLAGGPAPAILVGAACDIAMYGLQALRPKNDIEDARRRRDDAVKLLEAIRDGKTVLPGVAQRAAPSAGSPTPASGASVIQGPRRLLDRHTLREFT